MSNIQCINKPYSSTFKTCSNSEIFFYTSWSSSTLSRVFVTAIQLVFLPLPFSSVSTLNTVAKDALKAKIRSCHSPTQKFQMLISLRGKAKVISVAYEAQNHVAPGYLTSSFLFELHCSHISLLAIPQICRAYSYLRAFVLAAPSAQNAPPSLNSDFCLYDLILSRELTSL